jgi:hypothetical protein
VPNRQHNNNVIPAQAGIQEEIMANKKSKGFEKKIGEAATIGELQKLFYPFVNECPIRYDDKGPIEVFYKKEHNKDAVIILR